MLDLLTQLDRRTQYLTKHLPSRSPTTRTNNTKAKELEARGWRVWYAAIFGQRFVDALDSADTADKHHSEAIEWHWNTRRALIHIEIETRNFYRQLTAGAISHDTYESAVAELEKLRPLYLAYFTIWARGNLKTTIARRVAVCDACLSASAGVGGYALVVGGTKAKVRGTANSINALLTRPLSRRGSEVWRYYPRLAEVKRNKFGHSQGWTTDLIVTDADYVFHFAGLDEGMAGANEEDVRPTFILPDDIDNRKDSPVIAEKNFQTFTTEILPMRQSNTLVFYAQNLISRFSTMFRIWKQQVRVLTNRVITEPIPAVRNLATKVETVGGLVKDVFVSGKITWRGWNPQRVQEEIDTYGLPAFLRECQHEVEQDHEGLAMKHWNDDVHVMSRSQFEATYRTRDIPRSWFKYPFNDWARTKTKYHANVAGIVTVSAQDSPLPGHIFIFCPMSFKAGAEPEDVAIRLLKAIAPIPVVNGEPTSWEHLIKSSLDKQGLETIVSASELIDKRRSILAKVLPAIVRPILRAQNYRLFRGSHEREDVRNVMRTVFGLPFQPANPGADGGVDTLNLYTKVDYSQEHQFKPGVKGATNLHLVVEDGPDGLPPPYPDAMRPDELHDDNLFRYQMLNWRFRDPYLTVKGETEGDLLKMNDDFGNGLMMIFYDGVIRPAPLSRQQRNELKLDPAIRVEAIVNLPLKEQEQALHSRRVHLGTIEAQQNKPPGRALPKVRFRR